VRLITLANNKGTVTVDDQRYEELSQYRWHMSSFGYAKRWDVKTGKYILMHRQILNVPKGQITDHINRNRLDNREENLRLCDRSTNRLNSELNRNNTSGFPGVFLDKRTNKWRAQTYRQNKRIYLGYHNTPQAAFEAIQSV